MSWRGIALGAAGAVLLALMVALVVILTGGYNIAATERHTAVGEWVLNATYRNSVQARARAIEPPAAFTPAMVAAGAVEYKAMCEHCHGGADVERAEWAEGMVPRPPALARAADQWSAAEVFWLVKHGAKLTGMPAFGATHDDETLWTIAAFVKALPEMSAREYAGYSAEDGGDGEGGHSHAPGTPAHDD